MFKSKFLISGCICAIVCISSFVQAQNAIDVKNTLNFSRNEVISISVSQLASFLSRNSESDLRIKDAGKNVLPIQWIDYDGDGKSDELLFQANIQAKKTNTYTLVADAKALVLEAKLSTYSRLVPERADDYAWENDKIAFRVYGPKGQKEALEGIKEARFPVELISG